uniref:Uncharacterized protein ycf33 n=1 Tax=Gayliella sp. TaxID=2575623 RepID=A0A4D6WW31_9FLOR|nr:hypothetical protein [Gayliella sp.]
MNNFWNNVYRFPRFFVSVIIGFFLVAFRPIYKKLKQQKNIIPFISLFAGIIYTTYSILKSMLDIN